MCYLFVFRASPDVDHMAPVAWKLLEEGATVDAVISPGYRFDGDHRIALLRSYPRFRLRAVQSRRRLGAAATWARGTLPWALAVLRRSRTRLLFVEWGYGVPPGYDALPRPRGLWAVVRSLVRSVRNARESKQTRASFVIAARLLGIPTVCLPHGVNIKLDPHEEVRLSRGDRSLDWLDRNRFAAYVLNTEHHRRWHIEHAAGDPEVMQVWGSARWASEWFELNRSLVPRFHWPGTASDRLRVVFMLPRWTRTPDGGLRWASGVDGQRVVELVRRLYELPEISLAVAAHPRADRAADPWQDDPTVNAERLQDVSGVDSVALIEASDAVIEVGSSIGLEVIMQGKVLINPGYIYGPQTLFDAIPDSCVVAHDAEAVASYLRRHAQGSPHRPSPDAIAEVTRRAVYAGRAAPFDILDEYARRARELACSEREPVSAAGSREA